MKKFEMYSAIPQYTHADNMIVDLAGTTAPTVVTSDVGLKERLKQLGVSMFIGNGRYHGIKVNLKRKLKNQQSKWSKILLFKLKKMDSSKVSENLQTATSNPDVDRQYMAS